MSYPKYLTALAKGQNTGIVHVEGACIPVKIMDIAHESAPGYSQTTFSCLVINEDQIRTTGSYCRPSTRYGHPGAPKPNDIAKPAFFEIDRVIFNDPATIVFWKDGTKTVVKCQENDTYSPESGLAIAFAKKALGNKGSFNEVFKKYIPNY